MEQQQDAREAALNPGPRLNPEEIARSRKRQSLELARRQVLQQLQAASNPRHRQMLEAALSDLDAQLARET